jgi:hypothetical protein
MTVKTHVSAFPSILFPPGKVVVKFVRCDGKCSGKTISTSGETNPKEYRNGSCVLSQESAAKKKVSSRAAPVRGTTTNTPGIGDLLVNTIMDSCVVTAVPSIGSKR